MGEFILSRIRFRWMGVWEPDFSYAKDDIIEYEGKVYTCLDKHTSRSDFYTDLLNEDLYYTSNTRSILEIDY